MSDARLPRNARDIIDRLGPAVTLRLIRALGGTTIPVPMRLTPVGEARYKKLCDMIGEDAAKALFEKYCPNMVAVTCGKRGGVLYCGGDMFVHYPAFTVDAVDSNGAGDVFHGAFAYALTQNMKYEDACIFSSAVSALKCTKIGARDGVPVLDEVKEFLEERGYNEFKENME